MPNFTTFHQSVLWAAIETHVRGIIKIIINIAASSNTGQAANLLKPIVIVLFFVLLFVMVSVV